MLISLLGGGDVGGVEIRTAAAVVLTFIVFATCGGDGGDGACAGAGAAACLVLLFVGVMASHQTIYIRLPWHTSQQQ